MFGEKSKNNLVPAFCVENNISYHANASNQPQLFGNCCGVDPVNYFGNEHIPMLFPNTQVRETEDLVPQKQLQMSLNCNRFKEEIDRNTSLVNQNPVSTGLRLSYDDEERNSSVTSASGSAAAAKSILLTLNDNIRTVLERQKEELDRYIKIQEEQLGKGIKEMKQRHVAAFAAAIEKDIEKKLLQKDMEIENMNRRNKELVEKINHVVMEAQHWHYRAQYNESVVNVLKANLQQVISQGPNQVKEGFGDSEIDDTASYIHPNYLNMPIGSPKATLWNHNGMKEHLCRVCKASEVSILLMPCRHLCVCRDCDLVINVCPVCHHQKGSSFQVLIS